MKRLCILGAGGHGSVVADAAEACGNWLDIVFYDDAWPERTENGTWPIVGRVDDFVPTVAHGCDGVVALGDNTRRAEISERLRAMSANVVSIIHPRATVSRRASIGAGSVVFAGAVINAGARIGPACIINTNSTVEHDCLIEEAVHVSPGANLAGLVTVGAQSWIGIGACVRQQVKVGRNVVIGAGAVVIADVPDRVVIVGNPARRILSDDGKV